jgi:hypothetical protein
MRVQDGQATGSLVVKATEVGELEGNETRLDENVFPSPTPIPAYPDRANTSQPSFTPHLQEGCGGVLYEPDHGNTDGVVNEIDIACGKLLAPDSHPDVPAEYGKVTHKST